MFKSKFRVALRDMVESLGPQGTVKTIREMLAKKELTPEDFSLSELQYACDSAKVSSIYSFDTKESVSSDLLPTITGEIISAKIINAYQGAATIGDQLVTVVPSKLKTARIAGFTATASPDLVLEGSPYNDSQLEDKFVTAEHLKRGRIINLTEEAVHFDQTNQLLKAAESIGIKCALYREKEIIQGILDLGSNIYTPAGVAEALYSTSRTRHGNGIPNLKQSNPFGEEGLKETFKLLHNMRDEEGDFILIGTDQIICLFPYDLWVRALQMQQSITVPEGTEG